MWTYFAFMPRINGNPEDETMPAGICHLHVCKRSIAAKGGNTTNLFFSFKKQTPQAVCWVKSQRTRTATESLSQEQKYNRTSNRLQKLTDCVSYAIAKGMMPLSTVEKSGYKRMLSLFVKRYELHVPSRKYISQNAIPSLYRTTCTCIKKKVELELQNIEAFSISNYRSLVKSRPTPYT